MSERGNKAGDTDSYGDQSDLSQIQDFDRATETISNLLQEKVAAYGELAPECAEAYLRYGLSLLNIATANLNSSLFSVPQQNLYSFFDPLPSLLSPFSILTINTSLPPTPTEESEKNYQPTEDQDKEGEEERKELQQEDGSEGSQGEDEDVQENMLGGKQQTLETDQQEEEEEEEEEDLFELAWETLEVARVILSRQNQDSLLLAQVHLLLGDLSLEINNTASAVKEYRTSFEIRERLLPPSDPVLAETLHRLGTAQNIQEKWKGKISENEKGGKKEWLSSFLSALKILSPHLKDPTKLDPSLVNQLISIKTDIEEKIEIDLVEPQISMDEEVQEQPSLPKNYDREDSQSFRRITPELLPSLNKKRTRSFSDDQDEEGSLPKMRRWF